jgi:hypothetical protein
MCLNTGSLAPMLGPVDAKLLPKDFHAIVELLGGEMRVSGTPAWQVLAVSDTPVLQEACTSGGFHVGLVRLPFVFTPLPFSFSFLPSIHLLPFCIPFTLHFQSTNLHQRPPCLALVYDA